MTTRTPETGESRPPQAASRTVAWPLALAGLALAAVQACRPRQWPKNLLVFTAPLAGATLGRADGFGYALVAFATFTAASAAVYLVNDVADREADRLHPTKRYRPIAAARRSGAPIITIRRCRRAMRWSRLGSGCSMSRASRRSSTWAPRTASCFPLG